MHCYRALLAGVLGISPLSASTVVINLTTQTVDGQPVSVTGLVSGPPNSEPIVGGFINGVFFRRTIENDDFGSGSGGFRDLYRVQDNSTAANPEDGYNRQGPFPDVSIPGGFDPFVRVSQLHPSGTGEAFVFAADTHESTGGNNRFVSLDDLRIYVGSNTDPPSLPNSVSMLNQLGTPVYLMNPAGEQNHVLLDSSLYSGSGQMDLFFFVPRAFFNGLPADSFVYVYTSWGQYSFMEAGRTSGFDSSATPEQVASAQGSRVSFAVVPEPAAVCLLLAAGLVFFKRR